MLVALDLQVQCQRATMEPRNSALTWVSDSSTIACCAHSLMRPIALAAAAAVEFVLRLLRAYEMHSASSVEDVMFANPMRGFAWFALQILTALARKLWRG